MKKVLKTDDTVIMVNCMEANSHTNTIWTCRGDSFKSCSGDEVVFLEGYSGYFLTQFLKKVSYDS